MKHILARVRWPRPRTRIALASTAPGDSPGARLRHQAALAYLSRKALRASPSTSLLGDVCRIAARVLGADHVHVLELLPDSHTLIARAAAGWAPEQLAQWHMEVLPHSRVGQILRTGSLIVVDESTDADCSPGAAELLYETRMRCGLLVGIAPVPDAHTLFGVYSARRRRFSRDDIQFVRAVAPIVESAIRREAEMTLDRATRASNSAAQADLLRLVIHRLRPALRQSVSHLWKFRTTPTDTFTFRRAVKLSEKQVGDVAEFIETLSVLADVLDGNPLQRCGIVLQPLLVSLVDQFSERAATKGIALRMDVDGEFTAVSGDAALFRRAVSNLVDNAIRFSTPGGHVSITASTLDASVVIQVKDDGCGMTPDQLDALTRHRAVMTDSDASGPGLGWRLASAIVHAHGGTLTATSKGRTLGSTVSIHLPRLKFKDFSLPKAEE